MLALLGLAVIIGISFYTVSYGLWAWRKKMRRGAVGLFVLALLNLAAPVLVWLYQSLY